MSPLDPIARTYAAGRRFWKPQASKSPMRMESYPFEVPVFNSRKRGTHAQFHVLCRIAFEIIAVDHPPFGRANRVKLLILALDRATMEVRAVLREVYSREAINSRLEARQAGRLLASSAFDELSKSGIGLGTYNRALHGLEGEEEDVGIDEAEDSAQEEGQVRPTDS